MDPLFLDEMIAKPNADLPGEARRQDIQALAGRRHLRRAQGRLPAPEHHDLQAHGRGQGRSTSWSTTRVGGGFYEWKGYTPPKKGQPKYPYATMKELREHAEKNKLSIAQVDHGERGGRVRQDRGADQRLPGQDRRRDAGDREVGSRREGGRPARPDQAALEGGDRLRASPRTTSTRATGPSPRCRPSPWPRRRRTPAVTWSSPRRPAARPASCRPIVYALVESKRKVCQGEDPRGPARRRRHRLPVQAQRDALRRGGRLPVRDRRRLGHVRRVHRPGHGQLARR